MIWKINHAVEARSICRWSTVLTATGISEPSLFHTCCNVRAVAATNGLRIWLSALMRAAHCRSMRRWTFNGYMALIRSTSLTRPTSLKITYSNSYVQISLLRVLTCDSYGSFRPRRLMRKRRLLIGPPFDPHRAGFFVQYGKFPILERLAVCEWRRIPVWLN
jgi:hypothetical protein